MQTAAGARVLQNVDEQRVGGERARCNHQIDAGHIHVDDTAGADIQMAHFAVAHLAFR